MKRSPAFLNITDKSLPAVGGEHLSRRDRLRHQLCTLSKDLAGAQRVVTDLAVAHVVVGRKADRGPVSLELYPGSRGEEAVKRLSISPGDGVCGAFGRESDPVHNYNKDRAFYRSCV